MTFFGALMLAVLSSAGFFFADLTGAVDAALRDALGEYRSLSVRCAMPMLPDCLGHVSAIEVTVDGVDARNLPLAALTPVPSDRTLKGKIDRLTLRATDVRLDSLRASEVVYEGRGVRYPLAGAASGSIRVASVAQEQITVLFRDGDLDEYAREAFPELSEPKLTFEEGRLVARANVPLLFAAFPVTVSGRLEIVERKTVRLTDAVLDAGRIELTGQLRESLLKRLDPLLDLSTALPFPVPLEWLAVEVGQGQALFRARLIPQPAAPPPTDFRPRERYER